MIILNSAKGFSIEKSSDNGKWNDLLIKAGVQDVDGVFVFGDITITSPIYYLDASKFMVSETPVIPYIEENFKSLSDSIQAFDRINKLLNSYGKKLVQVSFDVNNYYYDVIGMCHDEDLDVFKRLDIFDLKHTFIEHSIDDIQQIFVKRLGELHDDDAQDQMNKAIIGFINDIKKPNDPIYVFDKSKVIGINKS